MLMPPPVAEPPELELNELRGLTATFCLAEPSAGVARSSWMVAPCVRPRLLKMFCVVVGREEREREDRKREKEREMSPSMARGESKRRKKRTAPLPLLLSLSLYHDRGCLGRVEERRSSGEVGREQKSPLSFLAARRERG